jgi:hypothetical protein
MGKESWLYRSGDIWLPKETIKRLNLYIVGNDSTLFYINYWHGMHMLSGILFGFLLLFIHVKDPFVVYFLLHTAWEAWQLWIGMTKETLRSAIDILIDTCMGFLGVSLVLYLI